MIIQNSLYMGSMKVVLFPHFMMKLSGIEVDECPKFLSLNPSKIDLSVYFNS